MIKFDAVKVYNGIEERSSTPISSPYEQFILCAKCDNEIINRYETYYAKYIFHRSDFTKKTFPDPSKINHYEYNNLDYNLSNIFFLSLLWRADLSNRPGFSEVRLPSTVSESIRAQILSGNYDKDSVKITALKLDENSNYTRSVTQFKKVDSYYTVVLRDLMVFFHFENDEIYAFTNKHGIEKSGKWILPEIPRAMEDKFIFSIISPQKDV